MRVATKLGVACTATAVAASITLVLPSGARVTAGAPASVWGTFGGQALGQNARVDQFDIGAGGALKLKSPSWFTVAKPSAIAVTPDARSVYVASDVEPGRILQYDVVAATGALTAKSVASVSTGAHPNAIAISPDGKSAYVTSPADSTIWQYDVGADGALHQKTLPWVYSPDAPNGVAVSPDGKSLYATQDNGKIAGYDVGADGTLLKKSPWTISGSGLNQPYLLVFSPDGKSLYVGGRHPQYASTGAIVQFDVGAGGALTPKSPAYFTAGAKLQQIAVSPDGKSVYVTNMSYNNNPGYVLQYDVAAGGALTPKSPATVSVGVGTVAIGLAVNPDGGSVYVGSWADGDVGAFVYQFDVGGSGLLHAKSPASVFQGWEMGRLVAAPDQGPVAAFSATAAQAGSVSTFDGSGSSDSDGSVVRYDWSFGDGNTGNGATPTHAYATAGTYTVTLTVTDNVGCATTVVFTGQTASCNGGDAARKSRTVTVTAKSVTTTTTATTTPVTTTTPTKTTPTATTTAAAPALSNAPCVVPNVRGKSLAAAAAAIEKAHCKTGSIRRGRSPSVKKGVVIWQSPKPGTRPKKGKVSLLVSSGR